MCPCDMDVSLAGGRAGSWCTWQPISYMPAITEEVGIGKYTNSYLSLLKLENILVLLLLNSFLAMQVRLPFGEELPLFKVFKNKVICICKRQNSIVVD